MSKMPPVVALLYSSADTGEMLRARLEHEGFVVVDAHTDDVRRNRIDPEALIEQHDPCLVVIDLIPPYDRHTRFLDHLRNVPSFHGRPFILMSANAMAARELGEFSQDVLPMRGTPADVERIVATVKAVTGDGAS
jgi:CheY-like chemotaxis protein